MTLIAIFCYPLRKAVKEGTYETFSFQNICFVLLVNIYDIILTSPFMSFIQKTPFLYIPFYKMMGLKYKKFYFINNATLLDPWFLEIGENVVFGFNSIVSAHSGEGDKMLIKKIKIGDNVVIGGNSLISPGCEIGNNSVIGYGSGLKKFTKVGENEVWFGFPAKRKLKKK